MMKCLTFLLLSISLLLSCELDHGIQPIRSGIEGVITYSGEWPSPPAEVRLVAATQFPPSDIGDLIIGESIPLTGASFNYAFYLKPGIYKIMGVAWRAQESVWDISSICGLYFSGSDSLAPGEVVIASDTSIVKPINLFVNRAKAKKNANSSIVGSIKFQGTWPDSIQEVRVIATTKFSPDLSVLPSLLDLSFSDGIPLNVDSTGYKIHAFPGTYKAIAVIFFKINQSLSLKDIYYSAIIGGLMISNYEVPENNSKLGPNFNIDFNLSP